MDRDRDKEKDKEKDKDKDKDKEKDAHTCSCCIVCVEKFNLSSRKKVTCVACNYSACRECWETWFLNGATRPRCMNLSGCGREFGRNALAKQFTQVFVHKTLKGHSKRILFERERALMPETQLYVGRMLLGERMVRPLDDMRRQIQQLQDEYRRQYNLQRELLSGQIYDRHAEQAAKRSVTAFVRPCPRAECMGFLSASTWTCGVCEHVTCRHCHVVKGHREDVVEEEEEEEDDEEQEEKEQEEEEQKQEEEQEQEEQEVPGLQEEQEEQEEQERPKRHRCHPDDVATASLLSRDTKPCPKCHTGITKINGCDQMWCTQCQTAFSWRTGAIETVVHNPHYYEWLRQTTGHVPRNPLDVPGGACADRRMLTHVHFTGIRHILQRAVSELQLDIGPTFDDAVARLGHIVQNTIHNTLYLLPKYEVRDDTLARRLLRIDFMRHRVDEGQYMATLEHMQKEREKHGEFHDVYATLTTSCRDVIMQMHTAAKADPVALAATLEDVYLPQFQRLFDYVNECLRDIAFTYKCTEYIVTETGAVVPRKTSGNHHHHETQNQNHAQVGMHAAR